MCARAAGGAPRDFSKLETLYTKKRDLLIYAQKLSMGHIHNSTCISGSTISIFPRVKMHARCAPRKYNFRNYITLKFNYHNLAPLCSTKQGPGFGRLFWRKEPTDAAKFKSHGNTALFIHLLASFKRWGFCEFPRLVGHYYSYLLPTTHTEKHDETWRTSGWIAL